MDFNIEILSVVLFGLVGSLGHCIGMCGGFIVTYSASKISANTPQKNQLLYHALYNSGRVTSYVLLGMLFGGFGALWDVTPLTRAILFIVAGLFMIAMAFSLSGKIAFLNSIEHNITSQSWYKKLFLRLVQGESASSFYFLGMLNGFFPCGLVYAALVWAMATGSIVGGALVMLLFGVSTVPALFGFGFFVGLLKKTHFRKIMVHLSAIIVLLFGAWTLWKGYVQFEKHLNPPQMPVETHHCH
ncbi:MAG: hypothetical protein KU37_03245 [Sulfuricurvum sp. PC08-66]|nr:MAG: hypothetical protein KU37_03245 [Sulfuricurvum sp. PC08-66]